MTLIEIMVVLVIMAMVAGAAGYGAMHAMEQARIKATGTDARAIAAAATGYLIELGTCPTPQELAETRILAAGSNIEDGWGHPFQIECDDGEPLVLSPGPDGQRDTEDDIDSRKKVR